MCSSDLVDPEWGIEDWLHSVRARISGIRRRGEQTCQLVEDCCKVLWPDEPVPENLSRLPSPTCLRRGQARGCGCGGGDGDSGGGRRGRGAPQWGIVVEWLPARSRGRYPMWLRVPALPNEALRVGAGVGVPAIVLGSKNCRCPLGPAGGERFGR